jgi:hypothetical protein
VVCIRSFEELCPGNDVGRTQAHFSLISAVVSGKVVAVAETQERQELLDQGWATAGSRRFTERRIPSPLHRQ